MKKAYNKHCIMWRVSRQSVDGSLQVLLVASKVNEGDDLARVVTDLLCGLALDVVDRTTFGVESENLVRDRRSAT